MSGYPSESYPSPAAHASDRVGRSPPPATVPPDRCPARDQPARGQARRRRSGGRGSPLESGGAAAASEVGRSRALTCLALYPTKLPVSTDFDEDERGDRITEPRVSTRRPRLESSGLRPRRRAPSTETPPRTVTERGRCLV